jgi:dTDP-4-dehydrorhamnose reductase
MRVLVTGASGFLGGHVARALERAGHEVIAAGRAVPAGPRRFVRLDLARPAEIAGTLDEARPQAIVHAGANPDAGACERDPVSARVVNVDATAAIARWCAAADAGLIFFSTDQVFSGEGREWNETDAPAPVHVYGRTKVEAEDAVRAAGARAGRACSLRVALAYGFSPSGVRSPVEQVVSVLRAGRPYTLFTDEFRSPILADDVGSACADLLALPELPPVLHLGGPERVDRLVLGRAIARAFGVSEATIVPCRRADAGMHYQRPADTSLNSALAGRLLPRRPRTLAEGLAALAAGDGSGVGVIGS